ncbi:MAG: hypothetical protein IKV97_04105 [Clostridia bacterium]|nr:hypothetical protein [Clostridia bacterium]
MNSNRNQLKAAARKTAAGALLTAAASALLIIGGVLEILDMTCAAMASAAILIAYLEFGGALAFSVYAASTVLSLIFLPMASSVFYFALVLGYYPILKITLDKKLYGKRFLRMAVKFLCFNSACALILFLFVKIYGFDALMSELELGSLSSFSAFIFAALLNVFLVMYDFLTGYVTVIYIKMLRPRIFCKK